MSKVIHVFISVIIFLFGDIANVFCQDESFERFPQHKSSSLGYHNTIHRFRKLQNFPEDSNNNIGLANRVFGKDQSEMGIDRKRNKKRPRKITSNFSSPHLDDYNSQFVSPSNGTDILSHPISVIKCNNQTACIQPKLQLIKKFDVYYCSHTGHGVRFYFLVKEGLLLHPNIRFVSTPNDADVIVYLPESAPWHKTECNKPEYASKTLVLDEGDGQELFQIDKNWLLYFKRSYVKRRNGLFKGYMHYLEHPNVLPMTYTIAEAYVKSVFPLIADRDLDIVCTLRGSVRSDPVRLR